MFNNLRNKKFIDFLFYGNDLLEKPLVFLLFLAFVVGGIIIAIIANGTCDGGDSVMHYLFARFSWKHHELFFNLWAKPLYVLIASPFAQAGYGHW